MLVWLFHDGIPFRVSHLKQAIQIFTPECVGRLIIHGIEIVVGLLLLLLRLELLLLLMLKLLLLLLLLLLELLLLLLFPRRLLFRCFYQDAHAKIHRSNRVGTVIKG